MLFKKLFVVSKYSVPLQQFKINGLKPTNSVLVSRTSPHISQLLSNSFHVNVPSFSQIEKIDSGVRRNGRISLREVEDVMEEIKSTGSASVSQSLMVIRCCSNIISEELPEKKTQLVQEIWNTLEKLGINLDISHYNALLRVYLVNEHPFVPTDLLAELEQKGIEPNRVTYQRFITRYCQIGDIEGATRILQFMREKEMPIDEVVFNALVLGHSNANDMEKAERILNDMRQASIEPTAKTYATLICGYIRQGNIDKVRCLTEECKTKDVSFSDENYLEMIYYSSLKDLDIDEILSKIRGYAECDQEAVSYVYKLVSIGKLENAFKIVKTMVRSYRSDGTLSSTSGSFIAALVHSNFPVSEIMKYVDKLIEENIDVQALSAAMENSLSLKKESLALDLFKVAKKRDVPLRTHYFWPLIVARGKQKDSTGIFGILSIMASEFNVPVSSETIREYVLPFVLNKKTDIPALLIELESCGVPTALATSAIVIKLLRCSKISQAAKIASSNRTFYSVFLIRKPLVNSFVKTLDANSFTTILKHIATGIQWRASGMQETPEKGEDEEEPEIPECRESIGSIVLDAVRLLRSRNERTVAIESVLELLQEKGVRISSKSAEEIQNEVHEPTEEITYLLQKLSVDDLPDIEKSYGFMKIWNFLSSRMEKLKLSEKIADYIVELLTKETKEELSARRQANLALKEEIRILEAEISALLGDKEKLMRREFLKRSLEANGMLFHYRKRTKKWRSFPLHERVEEIMQIGNRVAHPKLKNKGRSI